MDDIFVMIIFGHFVGDFFLQHKLMAENKFQSGWRASGWCALHVTVYTATVAIFAQNFSPLFLAGVFIPHFIADRYSFAYQWMRLLGRGNLMGHSNPSKASFGTVIYVVIDQTYHIGCLYLLLKLM
jgi:Protein of unknown function (DUF3307)